MCSKPFATGRTASCATACLLLALVDGQARAQSVPNADDGVMVPSETVAGTAAPWQQSRSWYGYQIMAADLTSLGLGIFGGQAAIGGLGVLMLPATIHGLHGRTGLAVASPLLRLGLPLLGAAIGDAVASCSPTTVDAPCGRGDRLVGLGLGLLAAMVLDWTLAAQSRAPAPHAPATDSPRPTGLQLTTAVLAPTANGVTLLLGGSF